MRERFFDGLLLLGLLLVGVKVDAKSFGVVGEVFPVAEQSLLQLIEKRLDALMTHQEKIGFMLATRKKMAKGADTPRPLGLLRAINTSRHDYKPEMVLKQSIQDGSGRVLYPAGTRINALDALPNYQPCWLFFNGDDKAQVRWAQKNKESCTAPKLILTGGSISAAEKAFQSVVYFDQAGFITQQLQIKTVPTRVTRQGNQLRMKEFAIKENGDAL